MDRWGLKERNLPARQHCPVQGTHHLESASQFRSSDAVFRRIADGSGGRFAVSTTQTPAGRNLAQGKRRTDDLTAASVNVGLWQFDRITNEVWATEHCRAMFGLPKDARLTRDTLLEAIHPEDRDTPSPHCGSGMPRNPS